MRFGPVIPEFTLLKITTFAAVRQKLAYNAKYLGISWTDLYYLYRFGRYMAENDYPWGLFADVAMKDLFSLLWCSTMDSMIVKLLSKD